MCDVISGMTGPQLIGFVAVIGGLALGAVVAVTGIVVPYLASVRKAEAACQLKRDLAAAGFKADEIERVVRASPPDR